MQCVYMLKMGNSMTDMIESIISEHDCVLFMKGSKQFPQCGFSAQALQILSMYGVVFADINILENNDLRQDLKTFSDWPTFPQLYVKGEFIGGVDIMREMHEAGELSDLFAELAQV